MKAMSRMKRKKRLIEFQNQNTSMTDRFKKGDTRSDGYRFKQYKKNPNGSWSEEWLSPDSFEKSKNWHKRPNAKESKKKWSAKNIEKIRKYAREYQARNRELSRERARAYAKKNPAKRQDTEARRRARINDSYSSLCKKDKQIIFYFYECASRVSRCLGILHHVDHIFPLSRGGPHIPSNLQILPASINIKKKDKIL